MVRRLGRGSEYTVPEETESCHIGEKAAFAAGRVEERAADGARSCLVNDSDATKGERRERAREREREAHHSPLC